MLLVIACDIVNQMPGLLECIASDYAETLALICCCARFLRYCQ